MARGASASTGSGVVVAPGGSRRTTNSWILRPAGFERSSRTVRNPQVAATTTCEVTSAGQSVATNVGWNDAGACVAADDVAVAPVGTALGTTVESQPATRSSATNAPESLR